MSTNIRIEKTCEYCGNSFIAKTTVTRYCSHICNSRDYKKKKREQHLQQAVEKEEKKKIKPVLELQEKEFLSIQEASQLLGISRWTLWRAIKENRIKAGKIGRRRIIPRSQIDRLF